jgi:hypothetical protein
MNMTQDNHPFKQIRLETEQGEYVATGLVPHFNVLPQVVLWGSRVFSLHEHEGKLTPVYREAFAVAVVMTSEDYHRIEAATIDG